MMYLQETNMDDEDGFEEEYQAVTYIRQRGRRDSRSLPFMPKCTCSSPASERHLCNKLENINISDVMQRRRDLGYLPQRSYSVKHRHFKRSDEFRPRTSSMPSRPKRPSTLVICHHDSEEDVFQPVQRVRTFSSSDKGGIVNRGDSFKRKGPSTAGSSRHSSVTSQGSSVCSSEAPCNVLVMGSVGVGKSSLIQQFTTSEYMGGEDSPAIDETGCAVPVLFDGMETVLVFRELSSQEEVPTSGVDTYLMTYSIDDHDSFDDAILSLYELRKTETSAAVILVANKADIIRHRMVTQEEGKIMAVRYDCKYIEVSTVLNMNVDELLAGIHKQIRLTGQRQAQKRRQKKKEEHAGCINARGIVGKIFKSTSPASNSCDDLQVL